MINILKGTTPGYSGYTGESAPAYASDGDFNTASGFDFNERGNGNYFYNGAYCYWTWNFASQNLQQIIWKIHAGASTSAGASENSGGIGVYITVTAAAGTIVLANESYSGYGNWSAEYSQNDNIITYATPIVGATQIQIQIYGKAKRVDAGAGGGNEYLSIYMYEMQAWKGSGYAGVV